MHDRLVVRTQLDGPTAVVASRGAAISAALHSPASCIRETISSALAGLPADAEPAPVSVTAWLRTIAQDRRLKPMTLRAAMLIGLSADGVWIGRKVLAELLSINGKNVPRTVRQLVGLGYLERRVDGRHVIYSRRLP